MDQLSAFGSADLDIGFVDIKLLGADNWTHLGLQIARIANLQV